MSLRFRKFLIIFAAIALVAQSVLIAGTARAAELTYLEQQSIGESAQSSMDLIGCGGFPNFLHPGCFMPMVTYYILYMPAVGLLTLSGYIFDFMMALSIDKEFIDQPFVNMAWKIVRDFSNMTFVFILLYTGIQTVLGFGKWQATIIWVIIIALLVNFSMFFAKVIIDAGNILAVGMYESVGSAKTPADKPHKKNGVPERNITASLVNAFEPQRFTQLSQENVSSAPTLFIIAAIVSLYVAFVFFKAAFLFMGRVIAFWFLIIVSPFALVSMVLPKWNYFDTWMDTLIKQAFVAPIFLFFIYLIMFAVNGGEGADGILSKFGEPTKGGFFFDMILVPIVITWTITFALKKALSFAEDMAGGFGKMGADLGNKVFGAAGVVATGGASAALGGGAMAARATVGQGAGKLLQSGALQALGTSDNKWLKYTGISAVAGRGGMKLAEKAHTGSFDIRETGIAQKGIKLAGIDVGKVSKEAQGGWKKVQEERGKEGKKYAVKFELTYNEKKRMAPEYENAKKVKDSSGESKKEAEKVYKTAKERSDSSSTGQRVSAAEKNLKEKQSAVVKLSGDALVKRIETIKKKQAEAVTEEQSKAAAREIEQVQNEAKKVEQELKGAAQELKEAAAAHEATDVDKEARAASQKLNEITVGLEAAEKIVKEAERMFEEENRRRRERIGYTETAGRFYYTKADRADAIKIVREGTSKDKKKQKEFNENLKKFFEEGEEEKPKAEVGEKK